MADRYIPRIIPIAQFTMRFRIFMRYKIYDYYKSTSFFSAAKIKGGFSSFYIYFLLNLHRITEFI